MENKPVQFFSSGSTLLDLALGGGWALGRVFNIVGDKSTGKTLLAIEAFANFKRKFPKGKMRYAEAEAAFDEVFAATLGFPDNVERPDEMLNTVEEFEADLNKFAKKGGPALYILDSLDALSDEAEIKKFEKDTKAKTIALEDGEEVKISGSYGTGKAKKMSHMFRVINRSMETNDCSLGIISQIRDNIGIAFGESHVRSGGRALDFYAAQVLWLSEIGKKSRQIKGEQRVYGINVRGKVKKNKVGYPFREADFPIIFGYGVDNHESLLGWLAYEKDFAANIRKEIAFSQENKDYPALDGIEKVLIADTTKQWNEIEATFAPKIQKYR